MGVEGRDVGENKSMRTVGLKYREIKFSNEVLHLWLSFDLIM